jgi:hypothetical protein
MSTDAFHADDEGADELNPLDRGAAGLPPVIGGGCLARFDPNTLTEYSGADFAQESNAD